MARSRFTAGLAGLAIAALALTGCSSSAESEETTGAAAEGIAALVPADIAADGIISFATEAGYKPNEYIDTDGKTIIGLDIDLAKAIAEQLGLEAEFVNAPFDSIIPGIQSGKYEAGISSFTIKPERMEIVDFVSYYTAGTAWAAKVGADITPDTACGKKVAVQQGTVQVEDIEARSKACTDAGKPAIKINQYEAQAIIWPTILSGQNDATLADSDPVRDGVLSSEGKLEVIGIQYDTAPYGIALPKGKDQLAEAVRQAVQAIMDNGTYASILEKWAATSGSIPTAEINPAL